MGRYDLENQVNIGLWNLDKLADALKPLLELEKHKQFEDGLRDGWGWRGRGCFPSPVL